MVLGCLLALLAFSFIPLVSFRSFGHDCVLSSNHQPILPKFNTTCACNIVHRTPLQIVYLCLSVCVCAKELN